MSYINLNKEFINNLFNGDLLSALSSQSGSFNLSWLGWKEWAESFIELFMQKKHLAFKNINFVNLMFNLDISEQKLLIPEEIIAKQIPYDEWGFISNSIRPDYDDVYRAIIRAEYPLKQKIICIIKQSSGHIFNPALSNDFLSKHPELEDELMKALFNRFKRLKRITVVKELSLLKFTQKSAMRTFVEGLTANNRTPLSKLHIDSDRENIKTIEDAKIMLLHGLFYNKWISDKTKNDLIFAIGKFPELQYEEMLLVFLKNHNEHISLEEIYGLMTDKVNLLKAIQYVMGRYTDKTMLEQCSRNVVKEEQLPVEWSILRPYFRGLGKERCYELCSNSSEALYCALLFDDPIHFFNKIKGAKAKLLATKLLVA